MTDIRSACDYLLSHDRYAVLMHASPDGDAVGSAHSLCRALQKLGKRAKCLCCDPIPAHYSYMVESVQPDDFEPEHIISVDLADTKLLGSLESVYGDKIELSIDHHCSNCIKTGLVVLDAQASAACEVMFELIGALGCGFDEHIADCLYTGIATDTGCFKFTNTSPKTHRVAADLIEMGANHGEINRIMFDTKSRGRLNVERMALDTIEFYFDGRCALTVITEEMQAMATPDELDGITALSRQIEGVIVGLTFRYKDVNRYKISVRTIDPVNASAVCARLGGGGHIRAAGCELNMPLAEAKRTVLEAVRAELEQ